MGNRENKNNKNKNKKNKSKKQDAKNINKVTKTTTSVNEIGDQLELVKDGKIEENRTNRSGVLLAILALMVPLVGVLFHYTKKWGRIIPESHNPVCWMHIVFIGFVTMFSIIVLIDIAIIVWADLNRYNVLKYDQADNKTVNNDSDVKYNTLLADLKSFLYGFIILLLLFSLYVLIYETEQIGWRVLLGIAFAFLIISLIIALREHVKKRIKNQKKKRQGKFSSLLPKYLIAVAIVVVTVFYSWFEVKQVIEVDNSNEGVITIDNYGVFLGEEITIEILQGNDAVFCKDVSGSEFEKAEEVIIHNIKLGNGEPIKYVPLEKQNDYRRYVFNLNNIGLEKGDYRYRISVSKYNTKVILMSEFTKVQDDNYIFAKPSLEKEY